MTRHTSNESDRPTRPVSWRRRLVTAVALCAAGWLLGRFVGDVDWASVASALRRLDWWQLIALVVLLGLRQVFNALPLALFIHGLGLYRAVVNDLAAHLLAVVAPTPSDVVLRLGIFASWRVSASAALAGASMNMVVFYTVRFSMPLIGAALLLGFERDASAFTTALPSGLIAGAILAAVLLAVRRDTSAAKVGELAGRVVAKVRRSVRPEQWSASAVSFRNQVLAGFRSHFAGSLVGTVAMVLVDATIVVLALRFVGVPQTSVPALTIYVTFALLYPLTIFPLMGLGIVDSLLMAELMDVGGAAIEPVAVAGLVVWRTVTLGGPILLGGVSLAAWRAGLVPPRAARPPGVGPGSRRAGSRASDADL